MAAETPSDNSASDTTVSSSTSATAKIALEKGVTQGRNVSGRSWKTPSQNRASSLKITKKNNQTKSWQKRQELKRLRQEQIALQKEIQEEKRQEAIRKKERRLENEKRRAENEFNNTQKAAQTLNYNTANLKLKTMSKKQLRQIKKTRLNTKTGVVEYVGAFEK
eukprot:CAMPEP_0168743114 /NCGR_PEP_ID=MMETSP0724-20121128/13393_1 /TAXON_ID=265536 /ORGANISM="Amphiprora sp., Strain CCMP467" /LENGTH=163 /DNA_ID=CAMNT_0008790701 /DNA_START=32 /DNA_END=523 /DNA_ORIENTATION=-